MNISIKSPEFLNFTDGDTLSCGANQEWYPTHWQRQAGCGPTTCSSVLWYLARTRQSCRPLAADAPQDRQPFQQLMESVWDYVTPGNMGVNSTAIFTEGGLAYARERGVALTADTLAVSPGAGHRPSQRQITDFVADALAKDLPVAFLNLSNGALKNLDSWHWVLLSGIEPGTGTATMLDDSKSQPVDLGLWLRTTALGGGFVVLYPPGEGAETAKPPAGTDERGNPLQK